MYSPKISEDLIPIIYRKSKLVAKTMTRFVDDLIRPILIENDSEEVIYFCCSCRIQVSETDGKRGFCDNCESEVFVEKI